MNKSIFSVIITLCVGAFLMTSCQRSSSEMWEDSKTASRQVGTGFRSLAGKHGQSRQIKSSEALAGPVEEEFIPLDNEDLYRQLTLGDTQALQELTQDSRVPQSRAAPGDPGSEIPGIAQFFSPENTELSGIFRNVTFGYNDFIVKGQENLRQLSEMASYLKEHKTIYIFVEGHCDERGPAAYNLSLGAKRSNSVRNLLIKEGVDLERIFTISYGKERPLVFGHNAKSWATNRRAQFKLFNKRYAR